MGRRPLAVAAGLAADRLLGEPPAPLHPVVWFGTAMERVERRWWRDERRAGVAYAAAGAGGAAATGWAAAGAVGPTAALAGATAVCAASRALLGEARVVGHHLEAGDLETARRRLPALVGRDPAGLDEKEMARAVVESVAENLSDAVVATALWGLVAGAPGALVHRAVNTMDAMVGHRTARHERFGEAAARLDDLLGWPAARLSAALVVAARPGSAGAVVRAVRTQAPAHPSPNAGVAEAAFAAALGLRLGGVNRYGGAAEVRAPLGTGRPPEPADVGRAVELADRVVVLLVALLAAPAAVAAGVRLGRRLGRAAR